MIHLVRDPRDMFNSRKERSFCKKEDCTSPNFYCAQKERYLEISRELERKKNYRNKYVLIKYEDLCVNPKKVVEGILQFLKVPYSNVFDNFINDHMLGGIVEKGWHSTFRNASETLKKWKTELDKKQRNDVEKACRNVIQTLGYSL